MHRWLLLATLGCAPSSDAAPAAASGDGSGTDPSWASSSGPSIEVPAACAYNPDFQCSAPLDCGEVACGGWNTPFDTNGCLRLSCGPTADCPTDHHCIFAPEWGGDTWDEGPCHETPEGTCDCSPWHFFTQSYCVPIDETPSDAATPEQHCAALDEIGCANEPLGICSWLRIVEVVDVDDCTMRERAGRCEAIGRGEEERPLDPSECPQAFFRVRGDGRVELTDTPLVPPISNAPDKWRTCSASEPACVCACDPGLPAG